MRSPLVAIFLVVVVDVLAFTLIIPTLPFYAERFGATPEVVGLLVSSFALCQLVAGPVLGNLSDRVGRRPVLVVSQLGTLAGFVVLAEARALWMVFLARILDGITAGNLAVAQAALADVTPPDRRARAFALIGVAFGVGFLLGPAASAALSTVSVTLPIWCAAGLSLTSVVLTLALLPETRVAAAPPPAGSLRGERPPGPPPPERRLSVFEWGHYVAFARRPTLAPRLGQYLLFSLSFVGFTSGLALYAERRFVNAAGAPWGPREVGWLLAYAGLLGVVLQGGMVGRVVARVGEARAVTAGFALQAAGFALLAPAHGTPMLVAAATLAALGNAPLRPALTALVSRHVGPDEQGVVLGLTQSVNAVAQVVAPPLAGALIGAGRLDVWALAVAALSALGLAVRTRDATPPVEVASRAP